VSPAPKIALEDSKTRLVEAAEQLMREDGYAAVTSRRVASKAGLKPQLVHYYFRSMDDLFLAILEKGAVQDRERLARALKSAEPLHALWEVSFDPHIAVIAAEFVALANHRKTIRAEIARYAEGVRAVQIEAIARILKDHGIGRDVCAPAALAVVIASVARVLVSEMSLGMSKGHAETIAQVKQYLRRLGGSRIPRKARKPGTLPQVRKLARAG
jgi:TetR/AcrR family transcriptional regulator